MGNGSDNQGFLGIRNTVSTIITVIKMLENKCSVGFKPSMESITYIMEVPCIALTTTEQSNSWNMASLTSETLTQQT